MAQLKKLSWALFSFVFSVVFSMRICLCFVFVFSVNVMLPNLLYFFDY